MSIATPSQLPGVISGRDLDHLGYPFQRLREAARLLRKRVQKGSLGEAVTEFLKPVFEAVPDDPATDETVETGSQAEGQGNAATVLLLPLFRLPALRGFWERELRRERFERLRTVLPEAWFADGTVLPPGGALPGLGLAGWDEFFRIRPHSRLLLVRVGGGRPVEAEEFSAAAGGLVLNARVHEAAAEFASRPAVLLEETGLGGPEHRSPLTQ